MILQELITRKDELVRLQAEIEDNPLDAEERRAQLKALTSQIEQLTKKIFLRRKKADLESARTNQPNDFLEGSPFHQQLQSINDLDEQYQKALAQMLLDEVVFRLRCRVEEEKKWWFWNRSDAATVLAHYEGCVASSRDELIKYLQASVTEPLCRDFHQEVSSIAIQAGFWVDDGLNERSSFSVSSVQNYDEADDQYTPVDINEEGQGRVLNQRYSQLKEIFSKKEVELGGQFKLEDDIQRRQLELSQYEVHRDRSASQSKEDGGVIAAERKCSSYLSITSGHSLNGYLPVTNTDDL